MHASYLLNKLEYAPHLGLETDEMLELWGFIDSRRRQLNIGNICQVEDVLHELMIYRKKAIDANTRIERPKSWAKVVAFRHLMGVKDKMTRAPSCSPKILEAHPDTVKDPLEDNAIYLEAGVFQPHYLKEVLVSLSESQRELFSLKYEQGLRWKEISALLKARGEEVSEDALRRRASDLMLKLRKLVLAKVAQKNDR